MQKSTWTQNTYGERVNTWADYLPDRWAAVNPLEGREFYWTRQAEAAIDIEFAIRYSTGIVPTMKVVYNGEDYDIKAVIDVGDRHRETRLLCVRFSTA